MIRPLRRQLARTRAARYLASLPLRPQFWKASYQAARHLWFTYGHLRTVRTNSAVDAAGNPLPWYTYPAIEYLTQFDFSEKTVFEYGSGNSTLFWSRVARHVTSVEHDEEWFSSIAPRTPSNCHLILEPDLRAYVTVIERFPEGFDIIVVDGPARGQTRQACARAALTRLRPGGFIVLDNSDWLPESARLLRQAGLLQVDMSGFFPIGGHTQTTSIYFDRTCVLQPKGDRQPQPSAAAAHKIWERSTTQDGNAIGEAAAAGAVAEAHLSSARGPWRV